MKVRFQVYLLPGQFKRLEKRRDETGMSIAEQIRRIIDEHFSKEDQSNEQAG